MSSYNVSIVQTPTNPMQYYENHDIISEATANLVIFVMQNVIEIISIVGISFNIVNIMIFYKQGLHTSTNMTLQALAFADLFNLLVVVAGLMCYNSFITDSFPYEISQAELAAFVASPNPSISRIRSWIYVFMTAERCLCIVLPLKIKQIITPARTAVAMVTIYVLNLAFVIPLYSDMYVDWKTYSFINKTLLGLVYRYERTYVTTPAYLASSLVSIVSFFLVVLLTSILIWKINMMSRWREKSTNTDQTARGSQRDALVIRLVVVIASVLVIFLAPPMLFYLLGFVSVDFSAFGSTGKYKNSMNVYGWLAYFLDVLHSCVNIFIYYNMNTSYRKTFQSLFYFECKKVKRIKSIDTQVVSYDVDKDKF